MGFGEVVGESVAAGDKVGSGGFVLGDDVGATDTVGESLGK